MTSSGVIIGYVTFWWVSSLVVYSNFFIVFCCLRPFLQPPHCEATQLRKNNNARATPKRCQHPTMATLDVIFSKKLIFVFWKITYEINLQIKKGEKFFFFTSENNVRKKPQNFCFVMMSQLPFWFTDLQLSVNIYWK